MKDLYPELTEEGKDEAQRVMDKVRENAKKVAVSVIEEELDEFYYHIAEHVESDSWSNYRDQILSAIADYGSVKERFPQQFAMIRRKMFDEYRAEIINDIILDLESRIKELEFITRV